MPTGRFARKGRATRLLPKWRTSGPATAPLIINNQDEEGLRTNLQTVIPRPKASIIGSKAIVQSGSALEIISIVEVTKRICIGPVLAQLRFSAIQSRGAYYEFFGNPFNIPSPTRLPRISTN